MRFAQRKGSYEPISKASRKRKESFLFNIFVGIVFVFLPCVGQK